jgi:hypothetical protein
MFQQNQRAQQAVRIVLLAGLAFLLATSLPGHLSLDSVMQLYEGRHHVRETFGPAVYAAILGLLDEIVPGTGLYVTTSAVILFSAMISLIGLRGRATWWAVALALLMVASPTLLLFQGVVWKDVLFANLTVAGFVCIAHAAKVWDGDQRPWLMLALAALSLAVAMSVRQNGLVLVVFAALALAWTARSRGWRSSLAWGAGGLAAVVLLANGLGAAAQPRSAGPDQALTLGIRILQHYDIVGAVAHRPGVALDAIRQANPNAVAVIRAEVPKAYSAERVDFLDRSPALGTALWMTPPDAIRAQWLALIGHEPMAYLAHRLDAFTWVFLTPVLEQCNPIFVGVEGPQARLDILRLTGGQELSDIAMANYATWFFVTPLYSHLSYALVALAVAGVLMLRRDPADMVMAAMMLGVLAFTASFFVISIACDYRYLYALDLAAAVGLLYLALDPPVLRRARRPRP